MYSNNGDDILTFFGTFLFEILIFFVELNDMTFDYTVLIILSFIDYSE